MWMEGTHGPAPEPDKRLAPALLPPCWPWAMTGVGVVSRPCRQLEILTVQEPAASQEWLCRSDWRQTSQAFQRQALASF